MLFLETDRLFLRNVTTDDVDIIFDYRNNEICSRYQRGQTKTYNGIKDLVQRRKDDKISIEAPFMLAVALKDTNEMIGEIVVMPNENTFSLGYTFSYKHHRQGYAFESLTILIDFLHKKFADWEFISFTDPRNEASMGLLIKLGYKNLGYLPSKESQVFGKWITKATELELKQVCL
jgi:RimJ/RimL family protein N-acetyltransferase